MEDLLRVCDIFSPVPLIFEIIMYTRRISTSDPVHMALDRIAGPFLRPTWPGSWNAERRGSLQPFQPRMSGTANSLLHPCNLLAGRATGPSTGPSMAQEGLAQSLRWPKSNTEKGWLVKGTVLQAPTAVEDALRWAWGPVMRDTSVTSVVVACCQRLVDEA